MNKQIEQLIADCAVQIQQVVISSLLGAAGATPAASAAPKAKRKYTRKAKPAAAPVAAASGDGLPPAPKRRGRPPKAKPAETAPTTETTPEPSFADSEAPVPTTETLT